MHNMPVKRCPLWRFAARIGLSVMCFLCATDMPSYMHSIVLEEADRVSIHLRVDILLAPVPIFSGSRELRNSTYGPFLGTA